jgi:hypothetical protein
MRPAIAKGSHGLLRRSTLRPANAKLTMVMVAIVPTRHQTSVARVRVLEGPAPLLQHYAAHVLKIAFHRLPRAKM